MANPSLLVERTNVRVLAGALVVLGLGLAMMALPYAYPPLKPHPSVRAILHDIGSLFVASIALTSLWELIGKRAFRDELWSIAKVTEHVESAGLVAAYSTFDEIPPDEWERLFRDTYHFDVMFAYARSWRGTHHKKLQRLGQKNGATIRAFLPDREDPLIVSDLARRFQKTNDEIKELIEEAETFFLGLRPKAGKKGAVVEVWRCTVNPVMTFYLFDDRVILANYTSNRDKRSIPVVIGNNKGFLYRFIQDEIEGMTLPENKLAMLISKGQGNTP